ncbi:MAG: hypothetical protein ACLGIR_01585 [Actinomycetes bacterium]
MRRRLAGILLPALLVVAVLLPATAAVAAPEPEVESAAIVLAVEEIGENPGPDPNLDNDFAPADYEANFLWGAAVGLLVLIFLGAGALGGLYWLLVVRPKQRAGTR